METAKEAVRVAAPNCKQLGKHSYAPNSGDPKDIRPDVEVPEDLGKLIRRDADLVKSIG